MKITSAKEILTTINILDTNSKKRAEKRHPKNEFQAFAYKLAHDLNDVEHLKIYLKLAKNVERSIMEKAYGFVIDTRSANKGRLFLWKLKQIRFEVKQKRDLNNFEYDFVIKKLSKFRDRLSDFIYDKTNRESHSILKIIEEIDLKNPRLLFAGNCSYEILKELASLGFSINCIEISRILSKKIKNKVSQYKKRSGIKIICKDFLKNSFDNSYFDITVLNNYWQMIPQDSEIKFMKEIKRLIKPQGFVIINFKPSNENNERWDFFKTSKENFEYFIKNQTIGKFKELVHDFNFKIIQEKRIDQECFFVLKNMN